LLIDKTLFGTIDRVAISIERLRCFEPPEGYYLAFSGGKDSQVVYHLAREAGVKFDAHYSRTTVDPPELVRFIKKNYPDVIIEKPELTMFQLIEKKLIPPTRLVRYCCEYLKEHGGDGRICVTGVRRKESVKRKNNRGMYEVSKGKKGKRMLMNDNDMDSKMVEVCSQKGKHVLNPIIDWSASDVWEFLNGRNIEHCCLYDEGFKRLGCIGCPMTGTKGMLKELERWPTYHRAYLRAFEKMLAAREARGKNKEPTYWHNAEEVMNWWIYGKPETADEDQMTFDDILSEE
jgi:phosphoadenosine phosphosulfate reductase